MCEDFEMSISIYLSLCTHVDIILSSCPAGHLRHRAYCILCFLRVEVLQKPNPQNHKNCKKKRPKLCKNHAKSTPLGSFWGDFGVILVPLGVLWRPWAPQGTPQGSRGEKTTKKGVRRPPQDPFWGRLGDLGRHRADIFFVFGCRVGDLCDDRRFDGQNVLHKRPSRPLKP